MQQHITTESIDVKPETVQRFWRQVDKTGHCWIWTGAVTSNGYGRFSYVLPDGTVKSTVRAHRYAWEISTGTTIPRGLEIDHSCHNLLCVNPAHLRTATRKQNSENRRGASKQSKSGVRGVFWDSSKNKWRARLSHNKSAVHVGFYDSLADAEAAIIAKRNELFTFNDVDRR